MSETQAPERGSGNIIAASPREAIENLQELADGLRKVMQTLRVASAPPDGLERHVGGIKVAEVAQRLGVHPTWISKHAGELEQAIPTNAAGTQRTYLPENIREIRQLLNVGIDVPRGARTLVVTIANQKGGVAKTTTTLTLAAEAAFRGLRVLIIDTDPQASTTASMLLKTAEGYVDPTSIEIDVDQTIKPIVTGELDDIRPLIRKTHWSTIDLIPAAPALIDCEFQLISALIKQRVAGVAGTGSEDIFTTLQRALSRITTDEYDLILIDTPPSMSITGVVIALASHGILIPIPPRNLDIESLHAFTNTLVGWFDTLEATRSLNTRWVKVMVTMRRADSEVEKRNERALRRRLSDYFIAEAVPRSEALLRSTAGAPGVYEEQPDHPPSAARSAREARRVLQRVYEDVFALIEETYKEMAR
jgi:chromosome partitioning protein